jgi:hypothetical protein
MARLLLMRARKTAWLLLAVLLALLVFGTQMPGAWRDETLRATHLPWWLAGVERCNTGIEFALGVGNDG